MTFVHLALIKGLLLIVVLSVDTAAINTSVTHLQTSNQESAELAKANELSNGAVTLYNAEKFKDALTPAKQALELRERMLPPDHKRVIASVGNLAAIYLALKNHKKERLSCR